MNNPWDDFYDEGDYELFDNSSEVDEIIENAMANVTSHFKQKVKDAIAEAKECESKLKSYKDELAWLEHQISDKKDEIERLKEEAEETEFTEIPIKYLARMVKAATNGLAPGDKVWSYIAERDHHMCEVCNGAKKINARIFGMEESIPVQCPKCKGYGNITTYHYKPKQKKVTSVNLKLCFHQDRVNYWDKENIYLDRDEMSTSPKYIFETEEEAQKWCDENNKKEQEKIND